MPDEQKEPNEDVLGYSTAPYQGWKEEVTKWEWKNVEGAVTPDYTIKRIEGLCPRCQHTMFKQETFGTVLGFKTVIPFWRPKKPSITIPVQCNCSVAHPPNAAGEGCGQSAEIPIP